MIQILTLLALIPLINGHANMVYPYVWSDTERMGWFYDENGEDWKLGCAHVEVPDDFEFPEVEDLSNYGGPDCIPMWFNNHVEIPGASTIPYESSQPETTCANQGGADGVWVSFPWSAPGSAPVYGPCGAMGGSPNGCNNDGLGEFGDCCPNLDNGLSCATYAKGWNAHEYEAEVGWPHPATTEWKAGSIQDVTMFVRGNHGGGYGYRLCKVPEGGVADVTEECMQNGHLDFFGDKQWVEYYADRGTGYYTELDAKRVNVGTFPTGSMWTEIPFIPQGEENGDDEYGDGHITDKVVVPSNLEPGEYVLSSRYDVKCTAQVYQFCANIRITN